MIIFIFRRDFRVKDNIGFNNALLCAKTNNTKIIPVFCLDKKQVKGSYFSNRSFQFLTESLHDLNTELKNRLVIYNGNHMFDFFKKKGFEIKHVFSNRDYTPYALYRDNILQNQCNDLQIECKFFEDYTLFSLINNTICTKNNTIYTVFSHYYNKSSEIHVSKPRNVDINFNYIHNTKTDTIHLLSKYFRYQENNRVKGGRKEALVRMKNIDYNQYDKFRDFPHQNAGSLLSAYLKYGCISIRELYHFSLNKSAIFTKQLIWKEFYAYLTYNFPNVLKHQISDEQNSNFRESTNNNIKWKDDDIAFHLWCEGKTGFPIVDAGMRELNNTGFMHNRLRMITSMFLTKHLHIDWRKGEKYFATKLIDYDPSSNNGGWQWSSGTGIDIRNYYRMFNPWTQSSRFDINCEYIKKWIPEIKRIPNSDIIKWDTSWKKYEGVYHKPIVDHKEQRNIKDTVYLSL